MIVKDFTGKKTSLLWMSEENIPLRIDFKNPLLNFSQKRSILRYSTNSVIDYHKRRISNIILSKKKLFDLGSQTEFSLVLNKITDKNFKISKSEGVSKMLSFKEAFSFNIYQNTSRQASFFQSYEKNILDFFLTSEKTRVIVFQDLINKKIRKNRLCLTKIFKKRLLWSVFSYLAKQTFKKNNKMFYRQRGFLKFHRPDLLLYA